MPDYLAAREKKEREEFIGIAADGWQWAACELEEGKLVTIKEIILDPEKPRSGAPAPRLQVSGRGCPRPRK